MIIITDSVKNVNRIIRRNNYSGLPSFGVEVTTALNLAWQTVIEHRSAKRLDPVRLISMNTASAIVLDLMKKNPSVLSFVPLESFCLATAREVLSNINLLRCNEHKEIKDSNYTQLMRFKDIYEAALKEKQIFDNELLLAEAVNVLETVSPCQKAETKYATCYFDKASMLEEKFVALLTNGKAEKFSVPSLSPSADFSFIKCYGLVNEADFVAKKIIDNNIPLGDVEILCDVNVYAPYLYEAFAKRNINCRFTSGLNMASFNHIQLLANLIDWYSNGCKYKDLFNIVYNPLFAIKVDGDEKSCGSAFLDGISYGIGWGYDRYFDVKRSEYDVSHGTTEYPLNKEFREHTLRGFGALASLLNSTNNAAIALAELIRFAKDHTYKKNPEKRFTTQTLANLQKNTAAIDITFDDKSDMLDYLKGELLGLSVKYNEDASAAIINNIYRPCCLERKHVFVIGLSSREFDISVSESPVIGDSLRKTIFGDPVQGNVRLAENAVKEAEDVLAGTLSTAPDDSKVYVICSSADVLNDCSDVSASAIYEKLLKKYGKGVDEEYRYYDITTDNIELKGETAWPGFEVTWDALETNVDKKFSKSTLDDLLNCPLSYHYSNELGINKEEYTNYDPGRWLQANEKGTLIHRIFELYANTSLIKNNEDVAYDFDENSTEFIEALNQAREEAEGRNAVVSPLIRDAEIAECKDIAIAYLKELHHDLHDNKWIVIACEERLDGSSSYSFEQDGINFNLSFSGIIDRLDMRKNSDGSVSYRICDYKTGKYKSDKDMIKDTKQHLIYANYVRNKYKAEVESFDYLFVGALHEGAAIWKTEITDTDLTSEILSSTAKKKNDISNKDLFYEVFVSHNYLCRPKSCIDCGYCKFKDLCLYGLV